MRHEKTGDRINEIILLLIVAIPVLLLATSLMPYVCIKRKISPKHYYNAITTIRK